MIFFCSNSWLGKILQLLRWISTQWQDEQNGFRCMCLILHDMKQIKIRRWQLLQTWTNYTNTPQSTFMSHIWKVVITKNGRPLTVSVQYSTVTHSLTGPLDWRRVVAPSRRRDHWPCPRQHLQRARHQPPAGGSMYVGDDLVDVSTPVWHQVGDRHGCWQPDEVLHALVLFLAVELATCWSQVRRPNHYSTKPPMLICKLTP